MIQIKQKFLVEKVGAVEESKNNKHQLQSIILKKPAYTDEFGEKKGNDDFFECMAWNKTIQELPPIAKGDKVEATLYLSGRENFDSENTRVFYTMNLSVKKIELL